MNMFKNYDNIPATYVPNNRDAKPLGREFMIKPLEEYNAKGELIGYSWRQGESVELEFVVDGEVYYDDGSYYQDADTYLSNKRFELTLYNFRYEPVKVLTALSIQNKISFIIDTETSSAIMKGIYYPSLVCIDDKNNIQHVLFKGSDCTLIVK